MAAKPKSRYLLLFDRDCEAVVEGTLLAFGWLEMYLNPRMIRASNARIILGLLACVSVGPVLSVAIETSRAGCLRVPE